MDAIRPRLRMFSDEQVATIVDDALAVLATVGFEVENAEAQALLREAGVRESAGRFFATEEAVRSRLTTVPPRVVVFDRGGEASLDLGGIASTSIRAPRRSTSSTHQPAATGPP